MQAGDKGLVLFFATEDMTFCSFLVLNFLVDFLLSAWMAVVFL